MDEYSDEKDLDMLASESTSSYNIGSISTDQVVKHEGMYIKQKMCLNDLKPLHHPSRL